MPGDRERVVGSLVAAFEKDPLLRCYFPDQATYPEYASVFFGYLFDKQVHQQTIWTIERGAAVAIWQAPGAGDEGLDGVLAAHLPAEALSRFDAFHEAMDAAVPAEPFWYLSVLGTHPESMGRRWGHAVMAMGLRHAAAAGLPAVLETSNPDNVEMYRRAGWEVVSTFEEPLPTWIMRQSG
ncbi:GNAT family N-acetyltransferase [Salinispora vitiensis]|uniref:GNAT family N-acetyltransferase n=1 Tax=Salinispora vitiensis TaxID=999544 RepID=UPI00035FCC39|nr:N-acetyltransferase [Salinispora vitiensis]